MILGLIPARLNSQRLPNKPLVSLEGIPIIAHVLKRAKMSKKIDKILVCADDKKIDDVVKIFERCGVKVTFSGFEKFGEGMAACVVRGIKESI